MYNAGPVELGGAVEIGGLVEACITPLQFILAGEITAGISIN